MIERTAIALIRFYQAAITPLTPGVCRFRPTCSEYAVGAVERHGAGRGGWMALKRIARCHPFGGRGYDPVPPVEESASASDAAEGRADTDPKSSGQQFHRYGQ